MADPNPLPTAAVTPFLAQRRRYIPKVDKELTLTVPGEFLRAKIIRVINPDFVLTQILTVPIAKTPHGYVKNDEVAARRMIDEMGIEGWRAVSEREIERAQSNLRIERDERERMEIDERERAVAKREADMAAQEQETALAAAEGRAPEPVPRGTDEPYRRVLGPRRSKIHKVENA